MKKEDIEGVKSLLSSKKNITIIPHKNPDGDAMGSTLALQFFLQDFGHNAKVIIPNDCPDFLKWLPGFTSVVNFEANTIEATHIITASDIIFTLDFNALHRTGEVLSKVIETAKADKIMIDHHQEPEDYTVYRFSDVNMSSTCEMVYNFICFLSGQQNITANIATCIYTGIMTDTGSFRYRSTTSTTHRIISDLIDKGANNTAIHNQVYDSKRYSHLQLLGRALQNLEVLPEYKTAFMSLSQKDLDGHNFKKGDTEGFVNYALSVKDVVFAAIFIENKKEGLIKISLRSMGSFSVNKFSRLHFNGGGHTNAAGGKSTLSLEATINSFLKLLPQYKTELIHCI